MFFDCDYRVCYGDTDKMGVVYYANYFEFFERGRTEMLRSAGFPYSRLEELGLFLPVTEANAAIWPRRVMTTSSRCARRSWNWDGCASGSALRCGSEKSCW